MQTAGARVLRDDDQEDMSREAVLLQWERKIEAAESRPRRFEREAAAEDGDAGEGATVSELRPPTEDATHEAPRRFERRAVDLLTEQPVAERRTITITGRPDPHRSRRQGVMTSPLAQPDRIALWAFLLGLFLVAIAAGTAHA